MSKLFLSNRVPREYDPQTFSELFRAIEMQVNGLSEGRISNHYRADSVVPTASVQANVGDVILNKNASSGAFIGWVCIVSGAPGTWTTFGQIS